MRHLDLALFAEGPTDHRFLRPLLLRLTRDICLRECPEHVDVDEVRELHSPVPARAASRAERIFTAARDATEAWDILFIHADGAGNPGRARGEQIEPARARIADEIGGARESVAVVPVRETEAWTLCDPDALRAAFRTTLSNEALGLAARPGAVESVGDPKAALRAIGARVAGPRARSKQAARSPHFLQQIGRVIKLERLRAVPAFQQLEADLREALVRLRVVR